MTTTAPGPGASDSGTIDALKRIKAVEVEWDQRLAEARREAESALRRVRDETQATVAGAHSVAESDRARLVAKARAEADVEAERIVQDGAKAAADAARGEGKRPADRRPEILAAVLGAFAPE